MTYKFLSLFTGIGGFERSAEIANQLIGLDAFEPISFCEINPFCQRVLRRHYPNIPLVPDVRSISVESIRRFGRIDGIVGGFPCQEISDAGKRTGLAGERSGLFYDVIRIVRLVRPRFVYLENVAALVGRGLPDVLRAFAEIRYDAQWSVVSCSTLGGSHRRERIWIIAYPQSVGSQRSDIQRNSHGLPREGLFSKPTGKSYDAPANTPTPRRYNGQRQEGCGETSCSCQPERSHRSSDITAYPHSERLEARECSPTQQTEISKPERRDRSFDWQKAAESLVRRCHDGLPSGLGDTAYLLRLVDVPIWLENAADSMPIAYRKQALQAYGNAIVPQVGAIGFLKIYSILNHEH